MSRAAGWSEVIGSAMLTAALNIAVFAVIRGVLRVYLAANAEFKPARAMSQLDSARYGRQKRQEMARRCCHVWQSPCDRRQGRATRPAHQAIRRPRAHVRTSQSHRRTQVLSTR